MQKQFVKLTDTLCLANNVIISFPNGPYDINENGPDGRDGLLAIAGLINKEINRPFAIYGDDTVHELEPDEDGIIEISPSHISTLPVDIQNKIRRIRDKTTST